MNDDSIFDYLLQMGAMQPEQMQLKRKQAMVDALRGNSMQGPQGQMVGNHYVRPSLTQYAAQLGNAFAAAKGQQDVDAQYLGMNDRQRQMLDDLRRRRMGITPTPTPGAYGPPDTGDGPAY